jgi:hypothetical protein
MEFNKTLMVPQHHAVFVPQTSTTLKSFFWDTNCRSFISTKDINGRYQNNILEIKKLEMGICVFS